MTKFQPQWKGYILIYLYHFWSNACNPQNNLKYVIFSKTTSIQLKKLNWTFVFEQNSKTKTLLICHQNYQKWKTSKTFKILKYSQNAWNMLVLTTSFPQKAYGHRKKKPTEEIKIFKFVKYTQYDALRMESETTLEFNLSHAVLVSCPRRKEKR